MKTSILPIALITLLSACAPHEQQSTTEEHLSTIESKGEEKADLDPIRKVERAHARSSFIEHEAIAFDIRLSFGGRERLQGRMTLATNSSKGVIEYANGDRLIFDEDKVYHNPEMKNATSARFAAFTWSYFFMFPYKLRDPGTKWSPMEKKMLNDIPYDYQMLTFEAGTGDAPDDWYKMYSDSESNLIQVAAYIVTAGATIEEAEVDPHAIRYESYVDINGVPIANEWTFWAWREDGGLTEQLGEASLSNFQFVEPSPEFYRPDDDYLEK